MSSEPEQFPVADNLWVRKVKLADLKEQDVNARVMAPKQFERLVENVRQRGALESLVYCAQPGGRGPVEIVSGHHRSRAAVAAGLDSAWVLIDTSSMTRSQIVAKQLAHNALAGEDDPGVLKELVRMIDNPDDLLASGIDESEVVAERDDMELFAPHVDFETRTISFSFLPHQQDELEDLLGRVAKTGTVDLMAVGSEEQFEPFLKAASNYARLKRVLSAGTAIAALIRTAHSEIDRMEAEENDGEADG